MGDSVLMLAVSNMKGVLQNVCLLLALVRVAALSTHRKNHTNFVTTPTGFTAKFPEYQPILESLPQNQTAVLGPLKLEQIEQAGNTRPKDFKFTKLVPNSAFLFLNI
jgi:hypothetical protein